jgi:quercetin dioxygenase-like cupin family protein
MVARKARVLGPQEGKAGWLGAIGVRFMIDGADSGANFSLVEHPMPPRALAAPLHKHHREDEYSFVVEGLVGAEADGEVIYAKPGDLIFKPRDQWHTFWNAGDEPARILEIISPAGFEQFFEEVTRLAAPDPATLSQLAARYGLEMDFASMPRLLSQYGVNFPGAG